MKYNKN